MSSDKLRVTGMASGLDTDNVVKQMMKPFQTQLDKLNQTKQIIQWKQDTYRSFLEDINTFKSTYFDFLKADSYMLSEDNYKNFDTFVYEEGTTTVNSGAIAIADGNAVAGTYNIDFSGGTLAKSAGLLSGSSISGATNTTLLKDLGITTTQLTIDYSDADGNASSKTITINPNTLTMSGLVSTINSETAGNVKASFSEITGKFKLETSDTGLNTAIGLTDDTNGDLLEGLNLAALGSGDTSIDYTDGTYGILGNDLSVKITVPGQAQTIVTNASNTFTADGISFTFSSTAKDLDIKITGNTQKTYDKIKGFVDKYNELIDKVGSKIEERKQYSYLPLTDEQKSSMKEEEITKWEDRAKKGILSGDSMLQNMLYSMRSAFYSAVEDAGVTLKDIGLSTSSDTTQRGKIVIDEIKLKDAITNKSDKVAKIFSKESTTHDSYDPDLTIAQRKVRFNEEGIFQRISDILLDYTRTTRNVSGKKGELIEKAGIKGDYTEYSNLLTKDLLSQQKLIDKMTERMQSKQEKYYLQFAKLETAMNNYTAQSTWLNQQIGAMNK